jgi:hypothetical protein
LPLAVMPVTATREAWLEMHDAHDAIQRASS